MPHMLKVKQLKWGMVSNGVTRTTEWSVRSGRWGGAHPGPSPHPLPGTGEASRTVVMALIPPVTSLSPGRGMFTSWIFCILVQML